MKSLHPTSNIRATPAATTMMTPSLMLLLVLLFYCTIVQLQYSFRGVSPWEQRMASVTPLLLLSVSSTRNEVASESRSESRSLRKLRSILKCDLKSSTWDDCLLHLNSSIISGTNRADVSFDSFSEQEKMNAAKKQAHEEKSLTLAIAAARGRLAKATEIHPRPGQFPPDIPVLTPWRVALNSQPRLGWSDMLFPDFTVAGLHKCGTSQLTHILTSHPKVRLLGKQNSELFFMTNYEFSYNPISPQDQRAFQRELFTFHQKLYGMHKEIITSDPSKQFQKTVASSLMVDDTILRSRYLLKPRDNETSLPQKKPLKFFIITRDPADWMWAAWNFWLDEELDALPPENTDRNWANSTLQYRSPELFHELLLGGDRVRSSKWFDRLRSAAVHSPRRLIQEFGAENVFFARNEDMLPSEVDKDGGLLDRLSEFTGLERNGFADSTAKSIHNCNDEKGNGVKCASNRTSSAYAIAGHREMLPRSRRLAYLFFATECKVWKEEFGIEYPDCLNAI